MPVRSLYFLLPVVLWLWLFKSFLLGRGVIIGENFYQFSIIKFYLDNIRTGVFPLWNPFMLWGTTFLIELINIGPFNPLWAVTLLLNTAGVGFYQAYLTTLIFYFFLGVAGAYLLAKLIFDEWWCAYASAVMILFSSLSMPLMVQPIMIFLFVPSVWFFYCFVRFLKNWRRRDFGASVFCLMIIFSTYLPFYFATVFGVVILAFLLVYPGVFVAKLKGAGSFARRNALLCLSAVMLLAAALFPAVDLFVGIQKKDFVVPFRQETANVIGKGAVLELYEKASDGDMSARMTAEDLIFDLDDIEYGNDGFFYVSNFAYIILLLGIVNLIRRRVVFLFLVVIFLLFLTIGNASLVHPFLFKNIFYFKLFRNLHYLVPFLILSVVFLAVEQLRGFWETLSSPANGRRRKVVLIVCVHVALGAILLSKDRVVLSSYLTLLASGAFFTLIVFKKNGPQDCMLLLLLAILLQPVEVLTRYFYQAEQTRPNEILASIRTSNVRPRFSFTRGFLEDPEKIPEQQRRNLFESYRIAMKDTPADFFPDDFTFPVMRNYYFRQHITPTSIRGYLSNKFWVYDNFFELSETASMSVVGSDLKRLANVVYISQDPDDPATIPTLGRLSPQAQAITGDGPTFAVLDFDVNGLSVKTNFPVDKFLVYNDSFTPGWTATLNGHKTHLFRANLAFKGVFLPAGENLVVLKYRPWAQILCVTLLAIFGAVFIVVLGSFIRLREGAQNG